MRKFLSNGLGSAIVFAGAVFVSGFVSGLVSGCSGQGSDEVLTSDGHGTGFVRVRWFPVDAADSYVLYSEDDSGTVVTREIAEPTGCTQKETVGFTSGLCVFDIKTPAENAAHIRVSALSRGDEGRLSRERVTPSDLSGLAVQ